MAANIVFNCDICGNPKRETNHWWMILTNEKNEANNGFDAAGNLQGSAGADDKGRRFLVVPWKAELATREGVHHACGQLCVLRAIERFMSDAEIFADAEPGAVAYEDQYTDRYAGRMLPQQVSDEGYADLDPMLDPMLEPMADAATVNAVAQSAVQSVIDSQLSAASDIAYAYDVDEEGELSAVISHAKPKHVTTKPASSSNHRSSHDGAKEAAQHLSAA